MLKKVKSYEIRKNCFTALPSGNRKARIFPTKVPIKAPVQRPKIISFILLLFILRPMLILYP